jgi:hypothetical protein
MKSVIERAKTYLAHIPPAISGSGGHGPTFSAAVALVKGFSLSEDEALPLLEEWNATCDPPWREADLRHKLRSAATTSEKPEGYLLANDRDAPRRPYTPPTPTPSRDREAEERAAKRQNWPTFEAPTPEEIKRIATLRKLPTHEGVKLLARNNHIKVAACGGHHCYVITEGKFAQARRLDGGLFTMPDGRELKARNLSGSEGAFIGRHLIGAGPVLMVEGVVGLVEAATAVVLAGQTHWGILAATSAGSRFSRDPKFLERLRGRRVRMVVDADDAGQAGAASWLGSLESVGAIVDTAPLPPDVKDLGALLEFTNEAAIERIFEL